MKKNLVSFIFATAFTLTSINGQAQSLKDLFNKDNITKVINTVTGHSDAVRMAGTWNYKGSAVEFESNNLLLKAGGTAASAAVEDKLNKELGKVGIKNGQMSFTFNADSTFTSKVGKRTMSGTYSYDASAKRVNLKYLKLLNMQAKVICSSGSMELLFNSDKLLKLLTFLGNKSNNATWKTVSSLANKYDGMMLGFKLQQ